MKSDSHTAPTPLPVIGSFQYREVKVTAPMECFRFYAKSGRALKWSAYSGRDRK
jgi:hypothetical protein